MATASTPLPLAFRKLSYKVKLKRNAHGSATGTKTILNDLSGICQAGRVMAIMGPSGAGKTSLLDVLAGRVVAEGELSLGSKAPCDPVDIQRRSSYVQQDDAIMASQTVREALRMATNLTLPRGTKPDELQARTDALLKSFHLDGCADTLVGDPIGKLKGISGGERKRLAVAMGAVREPRLIFLDEPTSGLDAHKAFFLVQVLKKLAVDSKSTVVCTCHQPSSDIFALFDDLMLLLDGRCVFGGPASSVVDYFGSIGHPCPQYANPADFVFMHVLTSGGQIADEARIESLAGSWHKDERSRATAALVTAAFASSGSACGAFPLAPRVAQASYMLQFTTLLDRAWKDVLRSPLRGKAQLMQAAIFGLIITLIWFQVSTDQNGLQDRSGVIFFFAANGLMQNVMGVLTTFANERMAVMREQENGMYSTLPYFCARVLVDMPLKTVCPVIFGSIAYWSVGLQADGVKFANCLCTLVLLALSGNSIGLFLGCVFPDVSIALLIAPMVILPLMMFSGFFLNPESSPVYLTWVEWISPMKYAFAALAQNEFDGLDLYCKPDQLRLVMSEGGVAVEVCPISSGNVYLENLNIQPVLTIGMCQVLLAVLAMCFTLLAYAALELTSRAVRTKHRAKTGRASKSALSTSTAPDAVWSPASAE